MWVIQKLSLFQMEGRGYLQVIQGVFQGITWVTKGGRRAKRLMLFIDILYGE